MTARVGVLALAFFAIAVAACDPVHDRAVAAQGPEIGAVGPEHRPGQPCLVCHGGSGPGPDFTMGGTVYPTIDATQGIEGVIVHIESSNHEAVDIQTNPAGNFYLTSKQFIPTYPIVVTISKDGDIPPGFTCGTPPRIPCTQKHTTHIGRDGSCAGCHVDPPSSSSPGRVWLYKAAQ